MPLLSPLSLPLFPRGPRSREPPSSPFPIPFPSLTFFSTPPILPLPHLCSLTATLWQTFLTFSPIFLALSPLLVYFLHLLFNGSALATVVAFTSPLPSNTVSSCFPSFFLSIFCRNTIPRWLVKRARSLFRLLSNDQVQIRRSGQRKSDECNIALQCNWRAIL